ncbi:glutamate synthase-related protein [Amycolatopsis sp. FDAARGOS 1241]|uniref:glutamate synthase-related protein n=1 Tax=Amycolatopsis sp. FDAARGOS 1241 TaxID=2778070 RepID=UPI00351CA0C4
MREVPIGQTVISPPYHRVFKTPRELVQFIARMRELAGGKPAGFKLCVGSRRQVLAPCKAMVDEGVTPDFIVVDGSEGGTGAAPLEFADHLGTPLTEGLITVHNALVGTGLRDRIRLGASGKVATGADLVKRLAQGADYTNAARAMMFAVGCIQSQRCHTNKCPVGVATQDPRRGRALDVADKSERVHRYQRSTVAGALQIMAAMGVSDPAELRPHMPAAGSTRTRSAPPNSSTTGSSPGGCSPSRRPSGRPTGRPPAPTGSPCSRHSGMSGIGPTGRPG